MDPKLEEALGQYKSYFVLEDNGKVKCEINGHSFPANRPDQISSFINGAKFAKLKVRYDAEHALTKYEPFIVVSKNFPHMLYCALTGQLIEKSLASVKRHMVGKRFQRSKARFVADEQELRPEPSLSDFGIRMPKDKPKGGEAADDDEEDEEDSDAGEAMDEDEPPAKRPAAKGSKGVAVAGAGGGARKGRQQPKEEEEEDDDDDVPGFWVPPNAPEVLGAGSSDDSAGDEEDVDAVMEDDSDVSDDDEANDGVDNDDDDHGVEAEDGGEEEEEAGPSRHGGMNGHVRAGRQAPPGANVQHQQPAARRESFAPVEGGKKGKKKKGKAQEAPEPASDDFEFAGGEDMDVAAPAPTKKKAPAAATPHAKPAAAAASKAKAKAAAALEPPSVPNSTAGAPRHHQRPAKKNVNRPNPSKKARH